MYALIKNEVVENVIIADAAFAEQIAVHYDDVISLDSRPEVGIGWGYVSGAFVAPIVVLPVLPDPEPDPAEWLIDVGPFFDRFGNLKMAILTSTDAGVRAILADLQVRHWIDLKRADVATGLAYVGSVVPSLTSTIRTTILTTPVAAHENLVLRKLYFK
jgi:hypothetical protein